MPTTTTTKKARTHAQPTVAATRPKSRPAKPSTKQRSSNVPLNDSVRHSVTALYTGREDQKPKRQSSRRADNGSAGPVPKTKRTTQASYTRDGLGLKRELNKMRSLEFSNEVYALIGVAAAWSLFCVLVGLALSEVF